MGLLRRIIRGLGALRHRERVDRDLSDEVRHYLERAEAELMREGATLQEARRAIRLRYGDDLAIRETVRSRDWETALGDLHSDLRLTARRLRRSPGFALVVTLILGLGIGAATAILSAVKPVLFDPLPYPRADRILSISDRGDDGVPIPVTFGTYLELSERNRAFEALAVARSWRPTLAGGDEPERLQAQRVSAAYFDVLGVRPALGRVFDVSADRPGGDNQIILGHALWRRRFAADPAALGRIVDFDGQPYQIVGVMPRGFVSMTSPIAEAWAPLQYDALATGFDTREWGHHLGMVGRTRAGVTLEDARADLADVAGHPIAERPRPAWAALEDGFTVLRLRDAVTADARPAMVALLTAVGFLLAVACVNLTILLLARGRGRKGELAMRAAMGAGRGRLVRQMLTESLALAALGGLLGVLLARAGLAALVAVSPAGLFEGPTVGLDGTTLAVALGITTLVGVLVGLVPALAGTRGSVNDALTEAGQRTAHGGHALSRALVVAEVALALVLLIGAGLLVRSTERLFSLPLGFDPSDVAVMQVYASSLDGVDATRQFWSQALDAVRRVPGVSSASLTTQLPLSGDVDVYGVARVDESGDVQGRGPAYRYAVTPGYFETLGIRRVRGRLLRGEDNLPDALPVAVLSESLARRLFPGGDPVGRRIGVGPDALPPYTIVGVVEDVKQESLAAGTQEGVYIASQQWPWVDPVRWVVLRSDGDPLAVVPAVRRAVWSVDGDQPIVRTQSADQVVARSEATRGFVRSVLTAFALFAVGLAGVGLYGVLSGSVAERMREIGVRAALGASRSDILTLVLGQGLRLSLVGVMIGVLGAMATSRVLSTLLFGVGRLDPLTYLAASALIALVAATACWLPAQRAARVDALTTLRAE